MTCGVSMPTRNAGPPASSNAAASRSASPSPRCGDDLEAVGHPVAGSPVEHEHAAAGARAPPSAAASVSASAAAASAAACSGVQGGVRRVFTRPGTGSLAMTSRAGAMTVVCAPASQSVHRSTAAMSRTARTVPRTRAGDLRAPLAGEVGDGHLLDPPAGGRGAQHHLQRPAEAAVPDAEREQRLAAGGAHRPEVGEPDAGAPAQLEREHGVGGAGVQRPAPRRGRAPGAEHEVGRRPRATGSATRGSSRGSNDASQSMKQTTSAVARRVSPAKHAAPKPGAGSRTTRAPSEAASSPEPSVEPLSTTIGS